MSSLSSAKSGDSRALFAGLCASFVGVGLARFAYTPLIPALIGAAWLTPAGAVYLGATNFAGYLLGALASQAVGRRFGIAPALRGAMLLTGASFLACTFPLSEAWLSLWRFVAGFTGALLMVLAAPGIVARLPAAKRGFASGAIFTGIGLGVAAAGILLPLLLQVGLREVWLAFGAIVLLLAGLTWNGWREAAPPSAAAAHAAPARPLRALYVEYGLNAFGLVPHFVFFVDYIARGLGQGVEAGAGYWIVFGVGACLGPLLGGLLADRIGFRDALRAAYVLQIVAVLLPLIDSGPAALSASAFIAGAALPGVVALTMGRTQELTPDDAARRHAWRVCTITFAVAQAAAGYLLAFVFARTGDYAILFALGGGALALCLLIDLAVVREKRPR
ncbi:MAG: YbfB/YjiJ family MFS transporter [Alphaproteobacteria bacterium]